MHKKRLLGDINMYESKIDFLPTYKFSTKQEKFTGQYAFGTQEKDLRYPGYADRILYRGLIPLTYKA